MMYRYIYNDLSIVCVCGDIIYIMLYNVLSFVCLIFVLFFVVVVV